MSALDAKTGAAIWRVSLGQPAPNNTFGCGNIDPNGVTGTPTIDYATRILYVAAAILDQGLPRHRVFALSLDDGKVLKGWPVDMWPSATFTGGITFDSDGATASAALLLVVNGTLYVPYGGRAGDCGGYHGWIAAIPTMDPQHPHFWATAARGGGSWAVSGPSYDGKRVFLTTGNTFGASSWQGGEAIVAFSNASLTFSDQNFYAPSNWQDLDNADADLGGTSVVLVDLPGSSTKLAVGLGKDGKIYLVDRDHLGGIGGELATAQAVNGSDHQRAPPRTRPSRARTSSSASSGTVDARAAAAFLVAMEIAASTAVTAWCATQNGTGSPMVTQAGDQVIVWGVGAEGDSRLHGFDGDTGDPIFAGGAAGDQMGSLNHLITPIAAKGKIYVGGSGAVYAFTP